MAACVPDDAIFVRLTFHRTNRRISDKSRFRRNLQSNRRRDRNPNARIRTGPQTNNDFFWRTEFLVDVLQVYKKWSGILPILCPFAHDKIVFIHPGAAAAGGGQFEGENLHFVYIASTLPD